MKKIYQLKREDNLLYVHYGYTRPVTPHVEAGQDSRIFDLNAVVRLKRPWSPVAKHSFILRRCCHK